MSEFDDLYSSIQSPANTSPEAPPSPSTAPTESPLALTPEVAATEFDTLYTPTGREGKLQANLLEAQDTNPDDFVTRRKIAQELRAPEVLLPATAEAQAELLRSRNKPEDIAAESPGVARWLENQDYAKLTGGDTTSLRQLEHTVKKYQTAPMFEQIVKGISAQMGEQIPGIKRGLKLSAIATVKAGVTVSPEERATSMERMRARQDISTQQAVPVFRNGVWAYERHGVPVDLQKQAVEALGVRSPEGKARAVLGEQEGQLLREWAAAQKQVGEAQPDIASPVGRVLYGGLAGAVVSAPYMAAAVAAPPLMPLVFGGPVYAQALPKYLSRGATPEEARLGALLEGASAALTESAPLGYVVKSLSKGGVGLPEFFANTLGREVPSEMLDTLISKVVDTAIANPNKTWGEAMAELPEELAIAATAALITSGGMAGTHLAAQKLAARYHDAAQRAEQQKVFDKLRDAAANEPVRARDTAAFRELIAGLTEGSDTQDIYIPARVLVDAAMTPEGGRILSSIPGMDTRIREGAISGDVAVPMADYLAHIAGSEIDETLLPHVRLQADGPTTREAQEYLQTFQTEIEAETAKLATAADEVVLTREEFHAKQAEERAAIIPAEAPTPQVAEAGGERRKDAAKRKRVSEMTTEERGIALLTDDLTSLGNRRAYEEADKKARQAYLDVDALGVTNDRMGHAAGDELLRAVGAALKAAGVEGYRVGGDELTAQHDDEATLRAQLDKARQILADAEITAILPDGSTITRRGIGFSYGTGQTTEEADAALYKDKAAREASGERAPKGQEPTGMVRRAAQRVAVESAAPAIAPAQTYEQYLAEHQNKQGVFQREVEAVHQTLLDELLNANRYTKDVAEAMVIPLRDFFVTQALRMGMTPSQFYAQYPLRTQATDITLGYGQDQQLKSAQEDFDKELAFANAIRGGTAQLEDFEYFTDYKNTIDAESTLVPPGNLMFVGSGPLPLSPIMFAQKGFTVTGMDISPQGKEYGEQIAYRAGIDLPVVLADATSYDFGKHDVVVLALEAGANTALKKAILGNLSRTVRPGGTILLRGSKTPDFVSLEGLLPENMEITGSVPTWGDLGETVAVKITAPAPLEGLPQDVEVEGKMVRFGPSQTIRGIAEEYMRKAGLPYLPPRKYAAVDVARAERIAAAFEAMPHAPDDPEVKAAYEALVAEALAQWEAIKTSGLKVEFITGEDPYANNPRGFILDIIENNHLWVFPTTSGFGGGAIEMDVTGNPLMTLVPGEEISGRPVQANDIFRIVHDYFGHAKEGVGFRAGGEENAWRIHSSMFSPLARKALTTETRGQNSWLNFGPYGPKNRTAKSLATQYAPQKTGLLPDWVVNEGVRDGLEAIGVHYSKEPRAVLEGTHYGTGMKGAEARRVLEAEDPRIKTRLAFYVDEGKGVRPESGVGYAKHIVKLNNLYDARSDPMGLYSRDGNAFESAVLDQGFSGYYSRGAFGTQGAVVLLGDAAKSVPVPVGEYAQFAGPGAHTADQHSRTKASSMIATGADPEAVRQETGWFQGVDGRWRFEIDDSDGRLLARRTAFGAWEKDFFDNAGYPPTVRDIIDHPALFAAYPFIADLAVQTTLVPGAEGLAYTDMGIIGLSPRLQEMDLYSTLMHEIQHMIQSVEGFTPGGNRTTAERILRHRKQAEFNRTAAALSAAAGKVVPVHSAWMVFQTFIRQAMIAHGVKQYDSEMNLRWGSERELREVETPGEKAERRRLLDRYYAEAEKAGGFGHPDVKAYVDLWTEMDRLRAESTTYAEIHGTYLKIAGEIEARDTQERLSLTAEQRKALRPALSGEVPKGGYVLVYNGTEVPYAAAIAADISDLGFYSALQQALHTSKQQKAPAQDWARILPKLAGVKKEELARTGLLDWLETLDPREQVTVADLLYIAEAGAVELEEITLEGAPELDHALVQERAQELEDQAHEDFYSGYDGADLGIEDESSEEAGDRFVLRDRGYIIDVFDTEAEAEQARDALELEMQDDAWDSFIYDRDFSQEAEDELREERGEGDVKFAEYRVFEDAGVAYQEHLIRLADNDPPAKHKGYRPVLFAYDAEGNYGGQLPVAEREMYNTDAEYEAAKAEDEKAIQRAKERGATLIEGRLPRGVPTTREGPRHFDESHWDESNVLGHLRTSETFIDGERLLLVEEIQSDWGQKGHSKGFYEPLTEAEKAEVKARESRLLDLQRRAREAREAYAALDVTAPEYDTEFERYRALRAEIGLEQAKYDRMTVGAGQIPTAPFVTDTKAWTTLLVKRLVRYAAENGYDEIVFPTGQQQVDLYRNALRTNLDNLRWTKADGRVRLEGFRGTRQVVAHTAPESELGDLIGKAMADKILQSEESEGAIEGDSIAFNSPGVVHFYNTIIPSVAKKTSKQLNGPDMSTRDLTKRGAGMQPSLVITPELREAALRGIPLFQEQRGSYNPSTLVISLMKAANLSTFHHESAHFYLEVLADMASRPDAPEDVKADFQKALDWFGVATPAEWSGLSFEQKRPYHEQWAESYERYLLEGKAPTKETSKIFARFRAWMLAVYKSIQDFIKAHPAAGKLNDEIRGVYDRLLASRAAIEETETLRGYAPLFQSADEAGMTEVQFQEYLAGHKAATDTAVEDLERRSLRDMQWASGAKLRAIKALTKEAAAKRKAIREEVAAEVMAEPVHAARAVLRKKDSGLKLHSGILRDMQPDLDLGLLKGMTSTENGTNPEQVANLFGFSSADAMVNDLIYTESAEDKIDAITDRRMLERFGELVDERAIERAANEAVHNEARSRFLATGLSILNKSPVPARELNRLAKESAEAAVARLKVRDIRPGKYEAAESRASKEALRLAAKDPKKAAGVQQQALLNNRLVKASNEALTEVDKALKYLAKFTSEGIRKNIDLEYLEQVDAMLAPFDLKVGLTLKEIDRRKSLADWVAAQEAAGFEPAIDQDAIAKAQLKSYKDMTMEELRGLLDAIKQVEHLGRLKRKLLTAKDAREFAARIDEARESIAANANRKAKEYATPSDAAGLLGKWLRRMTAAHRKFASVIREMDGGQDGGVMYSLLLEGMSEAGNNEVEMRGQAAEKMAELFTPILTEMRGGNIIARPKLIPGTNISLTNEQRMMFTMNWGNAGNRQRLLDGGITGHKALTEQTAQRILDTLTRKEWDFVQGVWDYLETFKPAIAELERSLTGIEPAWVEATPIQTKFGTYRGGYFPAKYDAELSTRSESLEAATNLRQAMKGAFNSAATRKGYTQKRSEEVKGRPLLLSFNAVSQHVSEVTHRLAWQAWLTDANRVLRALDTPIRESYGADILRELQDTVKDIAEGDAPANTPVETAINRIRVGSTIVGMGWRVTTALLQPSGLAQSWVRVGGPWMAKGVAQFAAHPLKTSAWVDEKSSMMRNRGKTMQREINEVLNVVRAGGGVSAVKASYFTMIAKTQRAVDMPTWLGAYEKALDQLNYIGAPDEAARKAVEEKAVNMADQAVLDSQGGGMLKDLSKVQRGSPALKLFTNFYSYFNVTYNLNVEAFRRTKFRSPSELGALAVDLLIINTIPALYATALRELLKGDCEWDTECVTQKLVNEQASTLFGQMILLREAGTAVTAATGEAYGYTGPAGLRFFADLYKAGQQAGQGDADLAFFKAANQATGALLHYPAGEVNNVVGALMAVEQGEIEGATIFTSIIAGTPKE